MTNKITLYKDESGEPMADSRHVAERLGRQHKHILEAIKLLDLSLDFKGRNFRPLRIKDLAGERLSHILMTERGFMGLCRSLKGGVASEIYEAFVNEFYRMRCELEMLRGNAPVPQLSQLEIAKMAVAGWEKAEQERDAARAQLAASEQNVGRLSNEVQELKPSAAALALITSSPKSILPRAAAKALGVGPNYLFQWFRENKWIYDSSSGVLPNQDKINYGLMELKYYDRGLEEYLSVDAPGRRPQVMVTGRGMQKLAKIFVNNVVAI
jgi:anti-repressor protein